MSHHHTQKNETIQGQVTSVILTKIFWINFKFKKNYRYYGNFLICLMRIFVSHKNVLNLCVKLISIYLKINLLVTFFSIFFFVKLININLPI